MEGYFNTHNKQSWGKMIGFGLLLYALLLIGAFFSAVGRLRDMTIGSGSDVAIGPITLLHINKLASKDGAFELEFQFKPGLVVLLLFSCLLVGLLFFAIAKIRMRKRH